MIAPIAVAILGLSSLVFVVLFGRLPALKGTCIGSLNHALRVALPTFIIRLDNSITSGRGRQTIEQVDRYLFDSNHSLVLIFFLLVLSVSEIIFIPVALPRLSKSHVVPISAAVSAPFYFVYKASRPASSKISPANHARELSRFPFDNILFFEKICPTCRFVKPARSKHCSICDACVSKHDHHCVWLKNCMGVENYRYFLYLLASLGVLLCYGALLGYALLSRTMRENEQKSSFMNGGGNTTKHGALMAYFNAVALAIAQDARVGAVSLLCLLTSPLPWGLLSYHLYLIYVGITTNESQKWASWRDEICLGNVVRKGRTSVNRHNISSQNGFQEPTFSFRSMPDEEVSRREWLLQREAEGFTRVKSLDEMQNIYDLGFKRNLLNAMQGI